MAPPIVTATVLRSMVIERTEAAFRGEISAEHLRGYITAMFHVGVLSIEECQRLLAGMKEEFRLDAPDVDA